MKKENIVKYKVKVILCISLVLLGAGCLIGTYRKWFLWSDESDENNISEKISEEHLGDQSDEEGGSKAKSQLEIFGEYLAELCKEGRWAELENHVISHRIDLKDAALLSDKSPLLEHIRGYAENELAIHTSGVCYLTADVDEDGLEDLIEYGPNGDNLKPDTGSSTLAIYGKTNDDEYCLLYSQQVFDTEVDWYDIIEVIRYEDENYLLFMDRDKPSVITAYWLSGGVPQGKCELTYQCRDVVAEIGFLADGYHVEWLVENSLGLYHTAYKDHCDVQCNRLDFECGSGEKAVGEDELRRIGNLYEQKYDAELQPYLEQYGESVQNWIPGVYAAYESDLNNDGVMERYVKRTWGLWLVKVDFAKIFGPFGIPFVTGEYRGHHEGREGLWYCIESEGEETDFCQMCGLDIWEGEKTPRFFWVEETEQGNVTYIAYQDKSAFLQRVDGYLIRGHSYERVASVLYTPIIECQVEYEHRAEGERGGVSYITYCTKDRVNIEIMWGREDKDEDYINRQIREALDKRMAHVADEGAYRTWISYWPMQSTDEEFIVECLSYYEYSNRDGEVDVFYLQINLETGECSVIEGREEEKRLGW